MKAIERLRNWATTILGIVLFAVAITMYVLKSFKGHEFSVIEMGAVAVLGYVFLMAKDSLLEGLFLNVFKIPKK